MNLLTPHLPGCACGICWARNTAPPWDVQLSVPNTVNAQLEKLAQIEQAENRSKQMQTVGRARRLIQIGPTDV